MENCPPTLLHTYPLPLTHESLTELQMDPGDTDLSCASCLLAHSPHNKTFSFLKNPCHSTDFYSTCYSLTSPDDGILFSATKKLAN